MKLIMNSTLDDINDVVFKVMEKFNEPVNIYFEYIPEEIDPNTEINEVLLEESASEPTGYGDIEFHEYKENVDITIFYRKKLETNRLVIEIRLQQALKQLGFTIVSSEAHYLDPETTQTIKKMTVERIKGLEQLL